jgi:hypothetical protein
MLSKQRERCSRLASCSLLDLIFVTEDGGEMFLRNIGVTSQNTVVGNISVVYISQISPTWFQLLQFSPYLIWIILFNLRSRDSSVGIPIGYELDGRVSIPGRDKFLLYFTASRPTLRFTQPPIQWVLEALSPGVKRQGREAHDSPPSSAEVKNGRAISALPHTSSWCGA